MGLKTIIIFFAGVTIGAAGMYIGVKNKFQKKADEEISEMRDFVSKKIAECHGKTVAYKEQLDQYKLVTGDNSYDQEAADQREREALYGDIEKVNEYINKYEYSSAEDEHPMDDDEYAEYRDQKAQKDTRPRIISEDEFADFPHFDKETLLYYAEDEVLCDESLNIVDYADRLFGLLLEDFYDDDDIEEVFVRCASNGSDYYIKKVFDSYDHVTS